MIEKRFTVIDREEPRGQSVAEKGIPCTARHCCTRLNRLTEENEQLQKDCTALICNNQEYRKENEQLKTQLQNTSDQRDEFHRGARENANRVGELEKENEQLRKRLMICQDKVKGLMK